MFKNENKAVTGKRFNSRGGKYGKIIKDNRPESAIQRKVNSTGLPDQLKSGIESLSGYSMDDVKVHYNSSKPAQLNAHAFAQGTNIHLASGQEKHLPHEAWHVVQQKQGRVKPTKQLKSKVDINDDAGLEKEADVMGARATGLESSTIQKQVISNQGLDSSVIQRSVISENIEKADVQLGTLDIVDRRYNDYKGRLLSGPNTVTSRMASVGLLHWAEHFGKAAAGSEAELKRVIYHQDEGRSVTLGSDDSDEPDITVYGRRGVRAEEVKAITVTNASQVNNQINAALAQLEKPRVEHVGERKAIISIYNTRNPWPWLSIESAKGKTAAHVEAMAKAIIDAKKIRKKGLFFIKVDGINVFNASGKTVGETQVEIKWENADSASRVASATAGVDSPYKSGF